MRTGKSENKERKLSLWAGTPMLTLPAETQTARVAVSLLKTVGLLQLVAQLPGTCHYYGIISRSDTD